MKLFWKIFFTTMFISVICASASGCIFLYSGFHSQLDSEVQTACDYGDIVYHSLAAELKEWEVYSFSVPERKNAAQSEKQQTKGEEGETENSGKEEKIRQAIVQIAGNIGVDKMNQKITFAIIDEKEETLFSSLPQELDKTMIAQISSANQRKRTGSDQETTSADESASSGTGSVSAGWALKKKGGKSYLQIIRPAHYQSCVLYLEILRDVTHIFKNEKEQCEMLLKIMAGMMLLAGVLTLILSKLLLRPIQNLSRTTKDISGGNLSKRASCRGSDEITLLSENFNQMADHLEEKICQLEEETEKKELFVGAFSHELKTPLTSIIGYADLLRRKKLSTRQREICIEYIFSEGKRLEHLSMRLLELIVLKKYDISPKPVAIKRLLEQVINTIRPQMAEAGIAIECEMEKAMIEMEEELMKTVFLNLLDNARKAMETGGLIKICGSMRQGAYALTIRDSGKGMEQRELTKIKEAFYMVDKSRSRKQGGAGLGLAICDAILKLHGFGISFESSPEEGTAVTVFMKGEAL